MTISDELKEIFTQHGAVTPSLVLAAAKSQKTALHARFEWDNKKASSEYRLIQARRIIKTTPIEYEGEQSKLVHVPRIESGSDESKEGEYQPISVVVKCQGSYERALSEALKTLKAAETAVHDLKRAAIADGFEDSAQLTIALESLSLAHTALLKAH